MTTTTLATALTAVFGSTGDSGLASTSKVPYFNSSNVPTGLSSMSALASILGGVDDIYLSSVSTGQTFSISLREGCGVFAFRYQNQSSGIIVVRGSDIKYLTVTGYEDSPLGARLTATSDGSTLTFTASQPWASPFHLRRLI